MDTGELNEINEANNAAAGSEESPAVANGETLDAAASAEQAPVQQHTEDDAIVSAVNEAAKAVADEAAAVANPASGETQSGETKDDAKLDKSGAPAAQADGASKKSRKETKKRIRRVGKTTPRKLPKVEDPEEPPATAPDPATVTTREAADAIAAAAAGLPENIPRVLSKHDEKWNSMFDKLIAYKVSRLEIQEMHLDVCLTQLLL